MASPLEIVFLGLCMFVGEEGRKGRTVVLPYLPVSRVVVATRGTTCVEPHIAYVSADKIEDCAECETMPDDTQILRLRPGEKLSISGIMPSDYEELPSFRDIPKMRTVCEEFVPDIPDDAVTMKIGDAGELERDKTTPGRERYAKLTVDTLDANIVVTATRGDVSRTMTLQPGAKKLIIGNQYANRFQKEDKRRRPLADNHWLAFYLLSANPIICDLPEDDQDDGRVEHAHGSVETTIACSNSQYP